MIVGVPVGTGTGSNVTSIVPTVFPVSWSPGRWGEWDVYGWVKGLGCRALKAVFGYLDSCCFPVICGDGVRSLVVLVGCGSRWFWFFWWLRGACPFCVIV